MSKEKIALAYSGGLDTSVMIKWLKDKYDAEIVAVTGNLGQEKEVENLEEKAIATGASSFAFLDLRKEFVESCIWPALKAGALYEDVYPLATALGRPLIAKALVDIALENNCTMLAHGCTGKGNDQVRFEVTFASLAPQLAVLAPLREWEFTSREAEIAYAMEHNIPVSATKKSPYSIDENIWGISIECGVLEDPMTPAPEDAYQITTSPEKAPDKAAVIDIEFEQGVPVALDGKAMEGLDLIVELNKVGAAHGVGRLDMVENRVVGIKSREIYEAPAATILHFAHRELERLTLEKSVFQYKKNVSQDYANLIYNGTWFSPMREALDGFIEATQKTVTGLVRVKLFKGSVTLLGRTSPWSLYNEDLATYTEADTFNHKAAEGFIHLYGLGLKTWSEVKANNS
ncbi:argininosuccinate synthase [Prosthecochloris sp. ZM]|uniref:Argininosuccinate synthase n=1 Tax=Prosthecochloris aestuarii (strain DSM 271 / SK 413) TaxID=290512 RepID=ASSY_PROA2|nr:MULTISPECIES: argininosuccinate synthase [Prosthecochloris]B4S7R9.1 RecName: Full=Argininosuccinate synthase; AltName: Full=Citrulline--aspartate ligase [Prosthecochloris aestuarii DSM 271]ACF46106.1 Argininosuccinate synthase [Prosthecochloris aestuarii DSM 271]NEX12760.1 argininosuccinate synthase [Prosthecochloris sp.]RDD30355.1 argininosuccinate synthase [Prosthecochloris sp. ZM]